MYKLFLNNYQYSKVLDFVNTCSNYLTTSIARTDLFTTFDIDCIMFNEAEKILHSVKPLQLQIISREDYLNLCVFKEISNSIKCNLGDFFSYHEEEFSLNFEEIDLQYENIWFVMDQVKKTEKLQ